MRFPDNRDPSWPAEVNALVERKVDEVMAHAPRLELADENGPLPAEKRRSMLLVSIREVLKATNVQTVELVPPALIEQFAVLAYLANHNIKGEMVQLIRCFMTAYAEPTTTQRAYQHINALTDLAREAVMAQADPMRFRWGQSPGAASESTEATPSPEERRPLH